MSSVDLPSSIILVSQDNERISINRNAVKQSKFIHTMIQADERLTEFPTPNIKGRTLRRVVEYMEYHLKIPPLDIERPIRSNCISDFASNWDCEFVNVPREVLFDFIFAANYLDIPSLYDLVCATVASMLKGKSSEEMRSAFGIESDFTEAEIAVIREENKWAED